MPRTSSKTTPKEEPKPLNEEILQDIAEQLEAISDTLACINEAMEDISVTGKMMTIFKIIELRPELKEKLGPVINEMVASMEFDVEEDEDQQDLAR
jgi:hypothetical protein